MLKNSSDGLGSTLVMKWCGVWNECFRMSSLRAFYAWTEGFPFHWTLKSKDLRQGKHMNLLFFKVDAEPIALLSWVNLYIDILPHSVYLNSFNHINSVVPHIIKEPLMQIWHPVPFPLCFAFAEFFCSVKSSRCRLLIWLCLMSCDKPNNARTTTAPAGSFLILSHHISQGGSPIPELLGFVLSS